MSDIDSDSDWNKFRTADDDDIAPIDTGRVAPGARRAPQDGGFPPPDLPPDLASDPQSALPSGREPGRSADVPPNLPPSRFYEPGAEPALETPRETRIGIEAEDVAPIMFLDEKDRIFKGDYVDLLRKEPTLRQVYIGAGWEHRRFDEEKIDIDLSCFLLDSKDETRNNEDFIFYNNDFACDGAVQHKGDSRTGAGEGDDEMVAVDLNGIPYDVLKAVFVLSVYDPDLLGITFDAVRDVYIRIVNNDDHRELGRLVIEDDMLKGNNAILALCLVRDGPRWHLEAVAQPSKGGLAALASSYGIIVKEQAG